MTKSMDDEHEKWFYDLEALAEVVKANEARSIASYKRYDDARRRTRVLAFFVVFAFLVLSYRAEVATSRVARDEHRIAVNTERIRVSQQRSCEGGIKIIQEFNTEQENLAAAVRDAGFIDPAFKARLNKIYQDARILPLPICKPLR